MEKEYWKVVVRYGHVGYRNEVSVARHLAFEKGTTIVDVIQEVHQMPGTKNNCIQSAYLITKEAYDTGKSEEEDNYYLQNLFSNGA